MGKNLRVKNVLYLVPGTWHIHAIYSRRTQSAKTMKHLIHTRIYLVYKKCCSASERAELRRLSRGSATGKVLQLRQRHGKKGGRVLSATEASARHTDHADGTIFSTLLTARQECFRFGGRSPFFQSVHTCDYFFFYFLFAF